MLCIASKLFDPLRIMKAFPRYSEVPKVVLVEVLLTASYEAVIVSVRPRWWKFNKLKSIPKEGAKGFQLHDRKLIAPAHLHFQ